MAFLQSDGGSGQGVSQHIQGFSALTEMLGNTGLIARGVLVLLLVASLFSWTVILGKWSSFNRATTQSRRFIRAFRKASRLQEISSLVSECPASPLATVFEDVYAAYKRQTGGSGLPLNMIALERTAQNAASEAVMALERRMTWWAMMIALERTAQSAASEAVTALERRMTWLATIGSVSPFVGLFGTVMGVVDAFLGLGQAGSGTLRAVAPGIAESLLTTAAGLFVAVPAVIAYNQFMARIRVFASATDDFSRELLNSLGNVPAPPPRSD